MHGPSRKMMLRLPPAYLRLSSGLVRRTFAGLTKIANRMRGTRVPPWWHRPKAA